MKEILTKKQFDAEWAELKARISRADIPPDWEKERESRLKRAEADKLFFAKTYFPGRFNLPWSAAHKKWPAITKTEDQPVMVKAPRSWGKSTFFNVVDALYSIVFKKKKYLLFVGYTEDKSEHYTRRIIGELLFNPRLKSDFGEFKSEWKQSFKDYTIFPDGWDSQVRVQAVSIGQDPRGLMTDDGKRPDFARLDDIQNAKKARSPKWVNESKDWIMNDLLPALAEGASCLILGTVMGEKDLISLLEKGSDDVPPVKTHTFFANEGGRESGKAAWAERSSYLRKRRGAMGRRNYMQEYNHVPKKREDAVFEVLKRIPYARDKREYDFFVSWTDPSPGKGKESGDYKAVVGLGFKGGVADVVFCWLKKAGVAAMMEANYLFFDEFSPARMFYEDNGGGGYLDDIIRLQAGEKGYGLPLFGISNSRNKEMRIEQTLAGQTEKGNIRFCEALGDTALLLEQLEDFPMGVNDDGPDALEGAFRMGLSMVRRRARRKPKTGRKRESAGFLKGR